MNNSILKKINYMLSKIFNMQMNDLDSGWDDLIFIPPGRSSSEHLATVDAWVVLNISLTNIIIPGSLGFFIAINSHYEKGRILNFFYLFENNFS